MFDAIFEVRPAGTAAGVPAANVHPIGSTFGGTFGSAFRGPERRAAGPLATRCLALMLDEIDYGMLLVGDGGQVLHVNHAARAELDADHPLQMLGRELRARRPQDVARLHDALADARRGLRKLLTLGDAADRLSLSVVPLGDACGSVRATLLVLGKRQVCERLSVQCFARSHGLTPAESRVLEALCQGLTPRDMAAVHGVGLATVRTQIGSIRAKTGAESIRGLVRQVSVLPPIVNRLRTAA
jgi:DNA-binding CsgD family transcriptional regulator